MITQNKVGVWILDDTYKKLQSQYWDYFSAIPGSTACVMDWDKSATTLGGLWVWGVGSTGELGQNDTVTRSSPIQIPGTWSFFDAADFKMYGIKSNCTLWGWGDNSNGDLGLGDKVSRSSPTQIGACSWCLVSGSGFYGTHDGAHAIRADGTLWGWGSQSFDGTLGNNDTIARSSPIQIPGSWVHVCRKHRTVVGIKSDGSLYVWGAGEAGQIGNNLSTSRSSPIQVPGTWADARAMTYGVLARKTDGSIWVWGCNSSDLGLGDAANRSSPVQLPGTYNAIATFDYGGAARKNDGTVVVWGRNESGQLGLNNRSDQNSPVQLPGVWNLITGSHPNSSHSAGMNGTSLYMWGHGGYGRLGLNDTNYRSSPVLLPGTWCSVRLGYGLSAGKK